MIGGIGSALLDIARAIIDLLLWVMVEIEGLIRDLMKFQLSQPVAFTVFVGALLLIFLFTPFAAPIFFGVEFNWNHALFGTVTEEDLEIDLLPSITEKTPAEQEALMDDIALVKIQSGERADPVTKTREALFFQMGLPVYESGRIGLYKQIASVEQGIEEFHTMQNNYCGLVVRDIEDDEIWEPKTYFVNDDWLEQLQQADVNPDLAVQPVRTECTSMKVDQATQVDPAGANASEKARTIYNMKLNGSLCDDYALDVAKFDVANPARPGGFVWQLGQLPWVEAIGRFFTTAISLSTGQNLSEVAAGPALDCYMMVNKTDRRRFYYGVPEWMRDSRTGNTSAMFFYSKVMLYWQDNIIPEDQARTISRVFVTTVPTYHYGLFSAVTVPYGEVKRISTTTTFGALEPIFEFFELVVYIILVCIAGMSGIALVWNAKNIH